MELIKDLRKAGRTILEQPRVLLLPAAALAQGLALNGIVFIAVKNCVAIKQAADYVSFLIAWS